MTKPEQPLPAGGPRRERDALAEIEHTTVSPFTVRVLLGFFLAAITAVPIAELAAVAVRRGEGLAVAWSHMARVPDDLRASLTPAENHGWWDRTVTANRIVQTGLSGFERALEAESLVGRSLRPPAQLAMTRWLGAGNERVYPGRDGWLFYRPDVEYVTGRGFLERSAIEGRIDAASEWTSPPAADPRPALAAFKRQLDAMGIALIVMPTPVKPAIHPEMLASGSPSPLHNESYDGFVDALRSEGVVVFDPSQALAAARRSGPQYLKTDTHWRPEAMEMAAEGLASLIAAGGWLPAAGDPGHRIERIEARNTGDSARMLDLPAGDPLLLPEAVWLRRVLQADGSIWRSARDADVLLLGDSFSNIYSLESMGWGTSAGLVEQLSYALRRPVDRLAQNDDAAFATRAMLARDPGRLEGKRVVIYQFAARELASGDWAILP